MIKIEDVLAAEWLESSTDALTPVSPGELIVVLDEALPTVSGLFEALEGSADPSAPVDRWAPRPRVRGGFVVDLALSNLRDDPGKLMIGLLGVAFAAFLMVVQVGLLLGFLDTTTALIAHSPGDLWIVPRGTINLETVDPQPERNHYRALGTPGVAWSGRMIAGWSNWKTPSGKPERCFVFGVDPERPVGMPWSMGEGDREVIFSQGGVVVDGMDRATLGGGSPVALGAEVEVLGHRSTVVGFSRDVRSFTTFPYVFTNLAHARDVVVGLDHPDRQVHYVIAGVEPGANLEGVRQALQGRLLDTEVLTKGEFRARTGHYWLIGTGVGSMSLLASFLGLLVGAAIVGQTIYSQTMERLREFGTFKALGATNRELGGVILTQALVTGAAGFVLGVAAALLAAHFVNQGRLLILHDVVSLSALLVVTLFTCSVASLISVRHVIALEPAEAFRA